MTKKLHSLLRLLRFELPFTAGICVLLGELLALGRLPTLLAAAAGFLCVFCISAAALILNDYFDLETDRINAPQRPLPSGLVSKGEVLALSILVTTLGLLSAALLGLPVLLFALLVWLVGFLYNARFKHSGLPGNLMVSFSVGSTFFFGGLAVGLPWEKTVWLFAVLVALIDLGEEIAADAMDLEGDRLAGSRSLAVLWGRQAALRISAAVFGLVILVSLLPFPLGWLSWIYALPLLALDGVILFCVVKLLDARVPIPARRGAIRAIYLSGMVAILVFIGFRLVGL